MRVFVAGATGIVGRRVIARCTKRDHEVVGLTRDVQGDATVKDCGGRPHRGDILDRDAVVEAATGADVVVHAATNIPTGVNPTDTEWSANDRVRRTGAANLVSAAARADARRLVLQSITWVARRPDGGPFDETAEPHPDRTSRSAFEAETIVSRGGDDHEFEAVILRAGLFYSPDSPQTQAVGRELLAGRLPIVGRGITGRRDAILSFVHVDDVGRSFADAIEGTETGIYHVVDDQPTTHADFLAAFADRLDAPSPSRVPAWLARFRVDPNLVSLVTSSSPTSNERFRRTFDWAPRYPAIREGLDQVVSTWRAAGWLRGTGTGVRWAGPSASGW